MVQGFSTLGEYSLCSNYAVPYTITGRNRFQVLLDEARARTSGLQAQEHTRQRRYAPPAAHTAKLLQHSIATEKTLKDMMDRTESQRQIRDAEIE